MSKWTSIITVASLVALSACTQQRDMSDDSTARDQAGYGQSASGNTEPNNTAVNQRDRADDMPTPMDQGQSDIDLSITQSIRQGLMADETLSVDAKNVKVITLEHAVALRGPVASEDEKTRIGQLAETTPNVIKVFNLLEVKAQATR